MAVFLRDMAHRWSEFDRLADLRVSFLEAGAFFDTKPYRAGDYQQRTPLMAEIRRDALEL